MKPFELRLAQEHARLALHLRNLRNFMADEKRLSALGARQQRLLARQADIMAQYVAILEERLSLLNITV